MSKPTKWKPLTDITKFFDIGEEDVLLVLKNKGWMDQDGRVKKLALEKKIVKYIDQHPSSPYKHLWDSEKLGSLLASLGYTKINPFLNDAPLIAHKVRFYWEEGENHAQNGQSTLAVWTYEDVLEYFIKFINEVPKEYKIEASAKVCEHLLQDGLKMQSLETIMLNIKANCGVELSHVQDFWRLEARKDILEALEGAGNSDNKMRVKKM